jgi:amino acid adenylation domain-containing protein
MSKMLHKFPVRVEPELQQQLDKWNSTQKEFPLHQCAHQLFEAQVLQNPDSIAISFNGKHLTYLELNHLANRMARFLVRRGVGSEILVALLADRSSDFLTAILAVFKAGGAYLPLDPLHPTERLRQVLMQSRSPFLLTTYEYLPLIAKIKEGIDHDKLPDILLIQECMVCELSTENLPLRCGPNNLAYVIMTSGSTGLPKGAMVEHRGMLNHLYAKVTELTLTRTDCVVQNASQCFDISVWQFLAILLVGGKVTILTDDVTRNPIRLLEEIEHANASIFEIVPSLLRAILEHIGTLGDSIPNLGALRWLILTGEALPVPLCRQWLDLYPNVPILNAYGPTECSDDVTHYPIFLPPHEDLVNIPIGRPIANIQLYVLEKTDTEFRLCGVGVSGELYVTGVGVGRGYINDPERTTAVFFQNPFSDDPSARMYRTGDLVQYLPDGNIVFLGRIDRQVKIRGFRIELGEIE